MQCIFKRYAFLGSVLSISSEFLVLGYMERSINRTIQTTSAEILVLRNSEERPRLEYQDQYKGRKNLVKQPRNDTTIKIPEQDEGVLIGVSKPKSLTDLGLETIFNAIR